MELVNENTDSTQDMNSCLVSCFSTSGSSLSLHADDECDQTDQSSSICTYSIGASRTMDFCSKKAKTRNPVAIKTLDLQEGCLTIMKPGCQMALTHRVNSGVHKDGVPDTRYSFSFRKYIPQHQATTPMNLKNESTVRKSSVILVAGDSYTARLKADKLGKMRKKVINVAKGGSTIKDVVKSLQSYADEHTNTNVLKLFLCVGTNDIQHAHHGVNHLKRPYIDMLKLAKQLFPMTKIFCQSLIPLPILKRTTIINVNRMNDIIFEACTAEHVYYLNVFDTFLNSYGHRNELFFPNTIKDIHPNNRGIGILAKFYIHLIHSKTFNPLGY